ncbi:MAG: hypothetical protein LBL83_05220, partial [Clostridiales bacterium]|nr:hypothetical protein [Clostridiales bacterium]
MFFMQRARTCAAHGAGARAGNRASWMGRTFYMSLLSAISLAIVPLAGIAAILSLILSQTVAKEYLQFNNGAMDELCLYIDENLARSMDAAQYLGGSGALKKLVANTDDTQAETVEALRAVAEHTRRIDPLRAFNPLTGVYMPTREFMVMGGTINRNVSLFYDRSFQFEGLSSEAFREMVERTETVSYIPSLNSGSAYLRYEPYICCAQNIPMGYISKRVFLLTLISCDDLESLILGRIPDSSFFLISAPDGTPLMATAGVAADMATGGGGFSRG